MKITSAALFVLAMTVTASAQTVEMTVDLNAEFGVGVVDRLESIDTDGDASTVEWLIHSNRTDEFMVIAVRPTGACLGPWFLATAWAFDFSNVYVQKVGSVSKLVTRTWLGPVRVVSLDTPACPAR